jgi:hypothetical protein
VYGSRYGAVIATCTLIQSSSVFGRKSETNCTRWRVLITLVVFNLPYSLLHSPVPPALAGFADQLCVTNHIWQGSKLSDFCSTAEPSRLSVHSLRTSEYRMISSRKHQMPRIANPHCAANPLFVPTILTTSSSATGCPRPTLCGKCFALAPHTNAYLKLSFNVL